MEVALLILLTGLFSTTAWTLPSNSTLCPPQNTTAPTLSLTTKFIVASAERVIVNVTCTTSRPDIGTAWLVNDESGNSSEVVYSVSNTYRFYITLADFGDMDRLAYQCVAYDPDRSERVIISSVTIWFNRLFGSTGISYQRQGVDGRYSNCGISSYGKISLFTRDKTGTLVELEDGDRVFNSTYFECRSFELCGDRPGVDLFWSFDNLLDDDKTISPVHAVINDYQISTFGFVPDFTYNITCKSRRTGEEISVITTSFPLPTTQPPPVTVPSTAEENAIRIHLDGYTTATFTDEVQLDFKQATVAAINTYCETHNCNTTLLAFVTTSTTNFTNIITSEGVKIADIESAGSNTILFSMYVLDGFLIISGRTLLMAVQDNNDLYETRGFSIVSAGPLLSPTPTLTTGQIVGIALGVIFFIILLTTLLIICVAWCCVKLCKRNKEKVSSKEFKLSTSEKA